MEILSKEALRNYYIVDSLSVAQISKIVGCSQNRINYWLQRYSIPKRTIAEALYRRHNPNGDPFRVSYVKYEPRSFLAGLGFGLYWGEGNKKNPVSIRLGNTDPRLIRAFMRFLIQIFEVPINKFRFGLQIFSDMPSNKARLFWLRYLADFNIKKYQFQKIVITPSRSIGTYKEKSKYGVLTIYFSNVRLKRILDSTLAKYDI